MLPFACVCQNQTIQQPFTMVCAHLIKMQVATLTTSYTMGVSWQTCISPYAPWEAPKQAHFASHLQPPALSGMLHLPQGS